MKLKIKRILLIVFSTIILILEALPGGVVLLFANPEGEPWRRTFSYFSLTPFGYANFGPLITAILSCILFILTVVLWFKNVRGIKTALKFISGIAVCTSLMPLIYGLNYVTPIGILLTLFLILTFLFCFIKEKE